MIIKNIGDLLPESFDAKIRCVASVVHILIFLFPVKQKLTSHPSLVFYGFGVNTI